MKKSLSRIFARLQRIIPVGIFQKNGGKDPESGPCPKLEVAIVGDIHGRADLLDKIITKIGTVAPDAHIIFVGDYVDRGPASNLVLARLMELGDGAVCLLGNHEKMMLEFLDDPLANGERWLRNGGTETLASYGIEISEDRDAEEVVQASARLRDVLQVGTEDWLRHRPLSWKSGNLFVTHAGPDPSLPLDQQSEKNLLWGHNRFLRDQRSDDIWVAHGHWIEEKAKYEKGRIAVDTGAYFSGRLTAAHVTTTGTVKFINS